MGRVPFHFHHGLSVELCAPQLVRTFATERENDLVARRDVHRHQITVFFNGRVVAIASDGAADCASADVRARVDSKAVRNWIKSQIELRFPF